MLSTIQKLLLAFVTLIVGLVLVSQIAVVQSSVTGKTLSSNEVVSIASARLQSSVLVNKSNETGWINSSGYTLADSTKCQFNTPNIVIVSNATSGQIILSGNYSLTGNVLYNRSTSELSWESVNITYNYSWNGYGCGEINTSTRFYPKYYYQSASGWRSESSNCDPSALNNDMHVYNSSGATLVHLTDYVANTNFGYITFLNTLSVNSSVSNTTYVSVTYCADGYLTEGWNRTVLAIVPAFFALALLIFSVSMFYSVARDAGIL